MEIFVVSLIAFLAALLTFFSGFGLGTILTPVFMIFFPVDLAIALTGIVHFFNNVFKWAIIGRKADRYVLLHFGIPAVLAAIVGSWLLIHINNPVPLLRYDWLGKTFEIYPLKLMISILMLLFTGMDILPFFKRLQFEKKQMSIGGALSGFFGGLSGIQGALRSAFLIKAGLSKETFIATTVSISCFVDFTRLSIYSTRFSTSGLGENLYLVIAATLTGILGSWLGNLLLKKATWTLVQILVTVMLFILSIALGAGFI